MQTFEQFLRDAAGRGDAVNTVFEERLFELVGVLHQVASELEAAAIPYEVIGGLAVLIHVEEVQPELSALTLDVDLMVCRSDLEPVKAAAAACGLRYRHAAGEDMLIGEGAGRRHAVHLLCSGEKVRQDYPAAAPDIAPVRKSILGDSVAVIPAADLVVMKLTSFRLKDQVHLQTLDAAGLITPDAEARLTAEMADRLRRVRSSE